VRMEVIVTDVGLLCYLGGHNNNGLYPLAAVIKRQAALESPTTMLSAP